MRALEMAWVFLTFAGLLEIAFASLLPSSRGFTALVPSIGVVAAGIGSLTLLSKAVEHLPVSLAYPIWVGIGISGAIVVDIVLSKDLPHPGTLLSTALIIAGIVGVKLFSSSIN